MRQNCQLTQWILVLLVAIVIGFQVSPALAFADPRINRLESQVRYLQSQVRQLDRQINQTQFSAQPRDPQVVSPTITPQTTQSPESTSYPRSPRHSSGGTKTPSRCSSSLPR